MCRALFSADYLNAPHPPRPGVDLWPQFMLSEEKNRELRDAIAPGRRAGHHPTDRKYLLFVAACVRRIEHLLWPDARRTMLVLHERYADGQLTTQKESRARKNLRAAARRPYPNDARGRAGAYAAAGEVVSWLLVCPLDSDPEAILDGIDAALRCDPERAERADREAAHQAELLRDIYGNPFRPVAFSPVWRTDTALALGRQMYEARDLGAMPILADALQDAGCDRADILDHCRGPGPHVRGCWVVDLLLGNA
jgi:hypothetical protein